ncbi:MAG: hypothetical protein K2Y23_12640 [Cyanobacteria bacterium]|nr:hypothetical protein [Cyanobacteriota bacterium]
MSKLARIVPSLAPEKLHELIRTRGLDECAEIVKSATPAQLTSLLDLDLWHRQAPGRDEHFDVDRFGEWLEALVGAGDSIAARTVAALDKDLVIAGLSRYVRVFDPGIFEPTAQSDDEAIDRRDAMLEGGGGGSLECEIAGYIVRARRAGAWDAIVALLIAFDAEHPHEFMAVMQGCRTLSNSNPEADGFHDLLLASEQHLHGVTIEREHRRSQRGYATAADARAFLQMARQPKQQRPDASIANPIVAAYFRAADEAHESWHASARRLALPPGPSQPAPVTHDTPEFTRGRELAFLANALLAGCSVQSRAFTPLEASEAAAAICGLGLEYRLGSRDFLLMDHDLVAAFESGWSVLHRDVNLFVANELISIVSSLHCDDRDVRMGLVALKRALVKHRDAGAPWLARDAAEVLAMVDMTAWISVIGLLDECPIVPAALNAVLDGRTTTVSPTEFTFISTSAQIGNVRRFMRTLPGVLLR